MFSKMDRLMCVLKVHINQTLSLSIYILEFLSYSCSIFIWVVVHGPTTPIRLGFEYPIPS